MIGPIASSGRCSPPAGPFSPRARCPTCSASSWPRSSRPHRPRYFSTRSASWRRRCSRSCCGCTTEQILPDDLPESIVESRIEPSTSAAKFHELIEEIKKQLVGRALKDAGGSYGEAAKILGLHPNNLHRLMKTLGMKGKE